LAEKIIEHGVEFFADTVVTGIEENDGGTPASRQITEPSTLRMQ
jgi:hypothetical protein